MSFISDQGLLAIAFCEAAAFLILLPLFLLLYRDLPARFFRLWLIGWTLFTAYGAAQVAYILRPSPALRLVMMECYLSGISMLLASVLEYVGEGKRLKQLWPAMVLGGCWAAFDEPQVLEREAVDLVVADLKMPGEVTGRELYRWICRRNPDLANRVVFTMLDARSDAVAELIQESGCAFVQKPFEVENFLRVIRQTISQPVSSVLKR